jgi:hypothetical protein
MFTLNFKSYEYILLYSGFLAKKLSLASGVALPITKRYTFIEATALSCPLSLIVRYVSFPIVLISKPNLAKSPRLFAS